MLLPTTTTTTTTSLPRLVVAPIQRHFCPRFIRPTRNKDPTSTKTRRIPTWTNTLVAATLTAAAAAARHTSSSSFSTTALLLSPLPRRHLTGYSPSIHAVAAATPTAFPCLSFTHQSSPRLTSLRQPSRSTRRMSSASSEEDTANDNGTVVDYTQFGPLEALCVATLKTCQALTPAIRALYQAININTNTANTNTDSTTTTTTTKADDSILTIADGIVQSLLIETLALQEILGHVVGEEEDDRINLTTKPYTVGETLVVPKEFEPIIDETRHHITKIRHEFQASLPAASTATATETTRHDYYQTVTAFIDPIDGTREFATNHGEQCTICVGFAATRSGRPVAGVIYRPLSSSALPPAETTEAASVASSWAVGAHEEQYFALSSSSSATTRPPPCEGGSFLTTNGRISPFLVACLDELHYHRVPSGGAGNKVLRLLEAEAAEEADEETDTRRPPIVYIQDRGVSRWDTCAAQAVLEAQGGILYNLERFLQDSPPPMTTRTNTTTDAENAAAEDNDDAEDTTSFSYTYRQTDTNLDFVPGVAVLTKYNAAAAMVDPTSSTHNKEGSTSGGTTATTAHSPRFAHTVSEVKPYANLGGLFAVTKRMNTPSRKRELWQALHRAAHVSPPAFD